MNFQKQFDVITGALNIFDMSYLVSGAAMFAVMAYAFPEFKYFMYNESHAVLSIMACVVAIYVLGIVCWLLGKWMRLRYKYSNKDSFEDDYEVFLNRLPQQQHPEVLKLKGMGAELAYSYMWAKLDESDGEECSRRLAYISRFWVLRAIYEGLMPSVALFAFFLWLRSQSLFCVTSVKLCRGIVCKVLSISVCSLAINLLYCIFVFVFAGFIIYILGMEARKCVKTQRREVLVAYYSLFIENIQQTKD